MLLLKVVAMVTMQALKFGMHPPDVFAVRSSVQQSFVGGMVTGCSQPTTEIQPLSPRAPSKPSLSRLAVQWP